MSEHLIPGFPPGAALAAPGGVFAAISRKARIMTDQAAEARQEALRAALQEYAALPMLAPLAAQSPLVPPSGPLHAPLVMIGEAPGREETEQLRPFAGNAGRVLRRLMREASLDERMVYFTNVVKFRPPGNRTPYPFEIAASRPLLLRELALVRPIIVVTLGATALRALIPDTSLSGMEGSFGSFLRPLEGEEPLAFRLLPLFHPALTFYAPAAEQKIREGLLKITGGPDGQGREEAAARA